MLKLRVAFLAVAALGAALLGLAAGRSDASRPDATPPRGGTFRVVFAPPEQLDTMDPAIANTQASWSLLDLTCARLMAYPDKPGQAAYRLTPEVAAAPPKVSRDGRTYTFTLRRTFRFSDGKPVDARAFARAINRTLAPGVRSLGTRYMEDIVGARAVPVRAGTERERSHRARVPPDDPPRAAARRLPRADEHAVLLRGAAEPSRRSRRPRRVPRLGPVLRRRVPSRPAGRHQAQPLLRRQAAALRRRLQRRPDGGFAAGGPRPRSRTGAPTGGSCRRRSTSRPSAGS